MAHDRRESGSAHWWQRGSLLSLHDLPTSAIHELFDRAHACLPVVEAEEPRRSTLAGRTIVNLFFEDSTRTRVSFAQAASLCGADVITVTATGSSVNKGESTLDTVRNVEAMGVDAIVMRHAASGAALNAARALAIPLINAGDGRHQHPTQGLLDAFTIRQAIGRPLTDLPVVIVGDILNSRVARSAIAILSTLGARLTVVGPPALAPRSLETLGVAVERDFDAVLGDARIVMMLRIQFERMGGRGIGSLREYRTRYALTAARETRMRDDALVMHPGPVNRGVELDPEVADGPRSLILRQVRNGVAIRMAVLELAVERGGRGSPGEPRGSEGPGRRH